MNSSRGKEKKVSHEYPICIAKHKSKFLTKLKK